jgi:hypothetical protein
MDIGRTCRITFSIVNRQSSIIALSLELSIADCRLSIADGHWDNLPHHFFNHQSAIGN